MGVNVIKVNNSDTNYTHSIFDISEYHLGQTYENLSAALQDVPQDKQIPGMSIRFVQTSDNKYVQFRLMTQAFSSTESDWQGVDEEPTINSSNLPKSGGVVKYVFENLKLAEIGELVYHKNHNFTSDYSHRGDPTYNYYGSNNGYDCFWLKIPENAISVTFNDISIITKFSAFSSDVPTATSQIWAANNSEFILQDYNNKAFFVYGNTLYFSNNENHEVPKLLILSILHSTHPDFNPESLSIEKWEIADNNVDAHLSLNNKKISILGASIDTFVFYSYGYENGQRVFNNRYPGLGNTITVNDNNNVRNVNQTWWQRLLNKTGAILERNNSIGSSSISTNRLYNWPSFVERYNDLGNPDIIIIDGWANEPLSSSIECTFDPTIPTADLDTLDVGQAYDKLIRLLMTTYPNAKIIDLILPHIREQFRDIAKEIDSYYNICHINISYNDIDYTTIKTDNVHPDAACMERISDYVINEINSLKLLERSKGITQEIVNKQVAFVSSPSPIDDPNILSYIVDEDKVVIAEIHKDGVIENLAVPMSPYNDENVLKYVTDEDGITIGYIKKDGTIHLYKAEIDNFDNADDTVRKLTTAVGLLANGADNIALSKNQKFINTLMNISTPDPVEFKASEENNVNLRPCISIIDDDTIDYQIPSSIGSDHATANQGGFFSVMLPFMLSLSAKHNKKCPVGLACEGQRVGLTVPYSPDDSYTSLNNNGLAVKWLHNVMGWNVFNHSMTAQLPMNTYFVDDINSELADTILAEGTYVGPLLFRNTIVLDRLTGKWYEVNSTKTAWVERTPTKKYALPYYRDYNTGVWYFNRDFDFEYSWGEWVKRADELGLPNEKVIVHNGSTANVYTAYAGRKYANFSIRTSGTHNYPPIPATVNRKNAVTGNDNVKNATYENSLKAEVDYCKSHNTWMVFMTHFNEQEQYRNYYLDGVTYPEGIDNYPSAWIIPLQESEILDIIGNNEHDYINHPPSRLGISTWDEWYPAPGTQLKSFYDVLDYALTQGIDIVKPTDGWNTHGNIVNLGVDRNGQTYSYNCEDQTPYTDEEQSYLTLGADISIRYFNKKSI